MGGRQMQAPSWNEWFSLLSRPEAPTPFADPLPFSDGWIDLFTDGTCMWPTKEYRIAAWPVVQATHYTADMTRQNSRVIAVGHVQGILQSAYRAELSAVCAALRFCNLTRQPVRLWCDCQGVVTLSLEKL